MPPATTGPALDGRPAPGVVRSPSRDSAQSDARIAQNPIFQTLVQERTRFSWILTVLMLLVYFGFIGLIAFDKQLLAMKVGGTASLGLFLGVFVILVAFALTGIYVARANTRFDALSADLKRSVGQ